MIDFVINNFMADLTQTHLTVGDVAPAFTAKDQAGNDISLRDYKGKKLVMFFYPKDNTPGCTKEACNLRDNYGALTNAGYALLGVSADSQKKHQNFIAKYDLPFPLLADEDKAVINAFGVWGRKKFMGREYDGILRTTFVIDEQGVIERIIDKVKTGSHSEQILVPSE